MEEQSGMLAALVLGLLLGLKHATDADHVVAVSTIVSEYRNPFRSVWIGASWGLGHTTPLLIVGIALLLLKGTLLQQYEAYSHYLEFAVGIMLVLLGLQVFWNLRRRRIHIHAHVHADESHVHLHTHELATRQGEHHGFLVFGRPFFRLKSYFIGIVHGLAGSAAVMLVVLTTDAVPSFLVGLAYILLFGIGTIISMALITLLMGVPFSLTGRFERLNKAIAGVAGTASILFGAFLMYELAIVQGF